MNVGREGARRSSTTSWFPSVGATAAEKALLLVDDFLAFLGVTPCRSIARENLVEWVDVLGENMVSFGFFGFILKTVSHCVVESQ